MKRIINKGLSLVAMAVLIITIFSLVGNKGNHINAAESNTIYKNTSLYDITGTNFTSDSNMISITDVSSNQNLDYTSNIITISSALELSTFSSLCNTDDKFLGYHYVLNSDIKASNINRFSPVGWSNTPFSGIFDGQGYEITGLSFKVFQATEAEAYAGLEYIAMFSHNTGTIRNLGLIDVDQVQSHIYESILGISPFVGLNEGTIENCFVRDLGNPELEESGISALGGYRISGFVSHNNNIISNCYVAYSIIVNYTIIDYIDFRPIATTVGGNSKLTNTYFYDASIASETNDSYVYDTGLLGGITVEKSSVFGERATTITDLNNKFLAIIAADKAQGRTSAWFVDSIYQNYNLNLKYPSLQGLEEITIQYESETINALEIKSANDFACVFKLANKNSYFASSAVTYYVSNDIDLSLIPVTSYSYMDFFSSRIIGNSNASGSIITSLGSTSISLGVTIYNFSITNVVSYSGYECYGLFPLFDGTIQNLNFYTQDTISNFNPYVSTTPTKAIGLVCGVNEGGTIENVRTYSNMEFSSGMGRYYAGGLCGIALRGASILSSTTAGKIQGTLDSINSISFDSTTAGYSSGVSLGGVVGFVEANCDSLKDLLSATVLTSSSYSNLSSVSYVGGIVGSGYFDEVNGLFYKGSIHTNDTTSSVMQYYIAGNIGGVLGVKNSILNLHNQGNIDVSISTSSPNIFISGCINAMLDSSSKLTTLYGSNFSNGGIISYINNATSISNLTYISGVAYLKSSLGFDSVLSGMYNLDYSFTSNYAPSQNQSKQNLDISSLISYAGCIYTDSTSAINSVNLTKVYNLRDVVFTTSKAQTTYSSEIKISGVVLGSNVELKDIRNEGDMTFNLGHNYTASDFIIMGVFEEISSGFSAKSIYNGGNIKFLLTQTNTTGVVFNLFMSGICYRNMESTYNSKNNPLSSDYNNTLVGSLDTVINNGTIESNAQSIMNLQRGTENQTSTINISANTSVTSTIKGNVRISGICLINEFIITNTFNLGNIINFGAMTSNYSLESAGISWLNAGRYAQIRDCANNGTIKTVNLSSNNSFVHSSGISVRNDLTKSLASYNNSGDYHHQQLICFTINYGEIYAFNYVNNVVSTSEAHSKVSGVLAVGLCSILNTVNYANIYGSEIAGGIFGYVVFSKYSSEVSSSSKVNLANSINYGNLNAIVKTIRSNSNYYVMGYDELRALDSTKTDYFQIVASENRQYVGAVLAVIDYASSSNAVNINIRYLINFNTYAFIVGAEINIPSGITTDNSTLISTAVGDTFMGNRIIYAPLSSISDADGNIGVFSPDFAFRKLVEGKLALVEETDKFVPDYFQFVGFTKINTALIESIGWRTIAYANAAEGFAKNMEKFSALIDNYQTANASGYQTVLNKALENLTWINNADVSVLKDTLEKMTENYDVKMLKEIIQYLFVNNSNSSVITNELRSTVVEVLLNSLDTSSANLTNILDAMMIDSLMAELIAKSDTEYADIQNVINGYVDGLNYSQLKVLAEQYINMLADNNIAYTEFFSNSELLQSRQSLLVSLLNGLPEGIYQELYNAIDTTNYDASGELAAILNDPSIGTDAVKLSIYTGVLTSNSSRVLVFDNSVRRILRKMQLEEYTTESNVTNSYVNNIDSSDYTSIWNTVKSSSKVQNYLSTKLDTVLNAETGNGAKGIYAKATEFRNSYQSNDSPVSVSGTTGRLRGEYNSSSINTRFIYVEDEYVSDLTYYYGPYRNSNGNKWIIDERIGWNLSDNSNAGATGQNSTQRYVPVFVSLNKEKLEERIASTKNPTAYRFFWNSVRDGSSSKLDRSSARSQYVFEDIFTVTNSSGSGYRYDLHAPLLYNTSLASDNIFKNIGYDLDAAVNYTYETEHAWTGTATTAESSLLNFYISSSLNTGIYYQQDQWINVVSYLTAKSGQTATGYAGDSTKYSGVITTSYIDYTISDLLNVDGIKTKGRCAGATSSDEVDIINQVMTVLLQDNQGISTILAALGAYGTQASVTDTNSSEYYSLLLPYLTAMSNNQTFVNDYVMHMAYDRETHSSLYVNSTTLIDDYIRSLKTSEFSLYDKLILYSISSKDNYQTIINYIINTTNGYYEYLKNSGVYAILTTNYSDEELKYISEMVEYAFTNAGLTNDQLKEMMMGIDMTKVEDFINSIPTTSVELSNADLASSKFTLSENFKASILTDSKNPYSLTALSSTATISFTLTNSGSLTIEGLSGSYNLYKNNVLVSSLDNLSSGNYTLVLSAGSSISNLLVNDGDTSYELNTDLMKLGNVFDTKAQVWNYFNSGYSAYSTNYLDQKVMSDVDSRKTIFDSSNFAGSSTITDEYSFTSQATGISSGNISDSFTVNKKNFVITTFTSGNYVKQTTSYISLPNNSYAGITFTLDQVSNLVFIGESSSGSSSSTLRLLNGSSGNSTSDAFGTVTLGASQSTVSFTNVPAGTYTLVCSQSSTSRIAWLYSMSITYDQPLATENELDFEILNSGKVYIDLTTTIVGTISITNGTTTYTQTISPDVTTYIFGLSRGQYKLKYPVDGTTLDKVVVALDIDEGAIINDKHKYFQSLNVDFSLFSQYGDVAVDVFRKSVDKYVKFQSIVKTITSADLTETYYKNIYKSIITTLYGVEESSDLLINELTDEQKKELIKRLATKDDTCLEYLLSLVDDFTSIKEALSVLLNGTDQVDGASELYLDVFEKMNSMATFTQDTHKINYLLGAFVGIDFINNQANQYLTSSYLYSMLQVLNGNTINTMEHIDIDFINADNSVDNDKLYNLLVLYNYPLATDGYGIYALASSKGILNGSFTPDNLNLSSMDPYYSKTSGYYQISDTKDNTWRGGENNGSPIVSDTTSVNYGFYVAMKQLKLSIATTVFDIRLTSTDSDSINYLLTQDEFIDLTNGIITFYVNSNFPQGVLTDRYKIDLSSGNYLLSYNASFADNTSSMSVGVGEEMIIRVFAEDITVYKDYIIRIVNNGELNISVASASVNGNNSTFTNSGSGSSILSTVSSTGGNMVVELNTNGLVSGMNLMPYLSLGNLRISEYITFNQQPIVGENGTVVLDMQVSSTLSKGSKGLSIVLPSVDSSQQYTYTITFDKEESSDNTLESITFDEVVYTFSGNIATSYILAGRIFNYEDFMVNTNNVPNYINGIVVAKTATVRTEVALLNADSYETNKTEVLVSPSSSVSSRICYKVTYYVTAENGNVMEYYHYIIEQEAFDSYTSNYATVYKDGEIDTEAIISTDGSITSDFTRGYTPNYRFSYSFAGFYDNDNINKYLSVKKDTEELLDGQYIFSCGTRYYGFNVNFFDLAEPGEYRFNLVYSSSTVEWNGSKFQRVITTPEVVITKLASTDAYLKKITFIDSASNISNLATVGYLSTIYPSGSKEPLYQTLSSIANSENNTNPIISSTNGLTYTEEAVKANNYYLVGTVSNATLEEYCPTFVIEDHAQIYQFKIINGIRKLYVPFEDEQGKLTVFLVDEEFMTNPGNSIKAYTVDYTGVEAGYTITSNSVVVDGVTYTVSSYAGSTNGRNSSLYMDYIGIPEEDEFWYVSYIIYAENPNYFKVYNIAILDLTNTILFDLTISDNSMTKLATDSSLYVTIVSYKSSGTGSSNDPYKKTNVVAYTMSAFAYYNVETNTYVIPYSLQKLPFGFFEFYIDLPDGYTATYSITTAKKENTNTDASDLYAYLPPASIVTQRIDVLLEVTEDTENSYPWGEKSNNYQGIRMKYK